MYLGPFGRQKERHSLLTCPRAAALRIASTLKGVTGRQKMAGKTIDYALHSLQTGSEILSTDLGCCWRAGGVKGSCSGFLARR